MTITESVYEAKTHLSELLDRVMNGEEVIISKPVARLTAIGAYNVQLIW